MGDKQTLGGFEELVLIAVMRLGANAYGVTIHQAVEEATGRSIALGAIYTTLERLENSGFVSSRQGEPTKERGGRAKRYFKIEGAGAQALSDAEQARATLRAGTRLAGGVA